VTDKLENQALAGRVSDMIDEAMPSYSVEI